MSLMPMRGARQVAVDPVVLTYRGTVSIGGSYLTTANFTSAPIGPAADRAEVIALIGAQEAVGKFISSVSIGGITATIDAANSDSASNSGGIMAIARAVVPTGTVADISVTPNSFGIYFGQVAVYTVNKLVSVVDSDFTNSNSSSVLTSAIATAAGGVIIAGSQQANGSSAATPTGWTSDVNNDWDGNEWFQALSRATDGTSLTPNITGLSGGAGVAASYEAA